MNSKERKFVETVRHHYRRHGRHALPWRKTTDPYQILVSEIMLQQTQVERVVPKYTAFIQAYPTVHHLARASMSEVLSMWNGLGYNRRGKMLRDAVCRIAEEYNGVIPDDVHLLERLPGIGPYTARAVCIFAFNQPHVCVETNIRTVFLHEFFPNHFDVTDKAIYALIEKTLDTNNPREWYAALMDYGAYLKKIYTNPSRKSKHYAKQAPFKGSMREVRGKVLRALLKRNMDTSTLAHKTDVPLDRIRDALNSLEKDGMITSTRSVWRVL